MIHVVLKDPAAKALCENCAKEEDSLGVVTVGSDWIKVYISGYGTRNAKPGHGEPIYIDLSPIERGSDPEVFVWADINQEDPTRVNLKYAHEDLYEGWK